MFNRLGVIVLCVALAQAAFAVSAGTTGFELLRTDSWARNAALAGSPIASSGDLSSIYSNPAGLAAIDRTIGAVGFFKHVLDINSGNISYATPWSDKGVLAASIIYFDYGKFDKATEFGEKTGDFSASDAMFQVSGARDLNEKFSAGVSAKLLIASIDGYSASALAADMGMIYHTGYQGWDVGAGVYNAGMAMSAFLDEKDDLPTLYKLGFAVPLEHLPVRVSLAGEYSSQESIRGAGGLELSFSQYITGRIGYNTLGIDQRVGTDRDALAGFSAGLGLSLKQLTLDYALSSQGEIGYLNRFTLSAPLGKAAGSD